MTIEPNDFQSRLRVLLGLQGAVLTDDELSHTAERLPPVSGRGIPARVHQARNPAPVEGTVVGAAQIHSTLNPRSRNQSSTSRSLSNWGISTSSPTRWRAASSSIS